MPELTAAVLFGAFCNLEHTVCENFNDEINQLKGLSQLPSCLSIARLASKAVGELVGHNGAGSLDLIFSDYASGTSVSLNGTPLINSFEISTSSDQYQFHNMDGEEVDAESQHTSVVVNKRNTNDDWESHFFREGETIMQQSVERNGSHTPYRVKFETVLTPSPADFCIGSLEVSTSEFSIDGFYFDLQNIQEDSSRVANELREKALSEMYDGTSISDCSLDKAIEQGFSRGETTRFLSTIISQQRHHFGELMLGSLEQCSVSSTNINFRFRGSSNIFTTYYISSDFHAAFKIQVTDAGLTTSNNLVCFDGRTGRLERSTEDFCGRDITDLLFGG